MNSKNDSAAAKTSFWQELKRRKVTRIAVAYVIVGWVLIPIAGVYNETCQ